MKSIKYLNYLSLQPWILVKTSRNFNRVKESQESLMLLKSNFTGHTFTVLIEKSYCNETFGSYTADIGNSDRDSQQEKLA